MHEYYLKHKEEIKAYQKKHAEENSDKVKQRKKQYYEDHKEEQGKRAKAYYQEHKEGDLIRMEQDDKIQHDG